MACFRVLWLVLSSPSLRIAELSRPGRRRGPRVPAVIISPYVQAGSIVRPPEGAPPFDHTSLIATLNAVFDLGSPLSPRAAAAPNLISALQLEQPENMGPPCIDVAVSRPTREEMLTSTGGRGTAISVGSAGRLLLAALGASAAAHTHRTRRRLRRDR